MSQKTISIAMAKSEQTGGLPNSSAVRGWWLVDGEVKKTKNEEPFIANKIWVERSNHLSFNVSLEMLLRKMHISIHCLDTDSISTVYLWFIFFRLILKSWKNISLLEITWETSLSVSTSDNVFGQWLLQHHPAAPSYWNTLAAP